MRTYNRALRICSAVVLFFFLWSFGPLFQIVAYAATPQGQGSGKKTTAANQPPTTGDRFEKALESIRENISKADEKSSKGQDVSAEIDAIKTKRIDIDSADGEFKKEFSATELKLKDAKLPKEILDRHAKFVKHYEDNLKELRGNLDGIDQATTTSDRKTKIAKARLHLEKVKTPSKHQKLNPNNLPFKARTAGKKVEPRLKKEQFEKDFPPQKSRGKSKVASSKGAGSWGQGVVAADFSLRERANQKPILLAFNGPVSDVPFQLPRPLWERTEVRGGFDIPQIAFSDSSPFLLAQATDQPTADDLAETPEIQFTTEIRNKAQELGNDPVKIYNWVRNNIDYQCYYGSFKGAAQTLAEGSGNDFDQASLLIALLRASNIAAKYAYGTVEIPAAKAANMAGVSDARSAATMLATQGIPVKTIMSGGTVKAIQMEKVWVETWIDYFPSWGARHKQGGEDTWIPLDPSFKQYTYTQGMDMYSLMGFNADDFLMSYITDTRDITAYQDYSMRMLDFLDANYPDASVEDVLGGSEIKETKIIEKQEFPYLLGTLPYKVVVKAVQFSQVPSTQDYAITIQIEGDLLDGTSGLSYTGGLSDLASKRITVSYEPATSSDEALIAQYDGNVYAVPPYLLNVKPTLRIGGVVAATGGPIGMGKNQTIVISFAGPDGDTDRIQNIITAGVYSAIILQSQNTPLTITSNNMAAFLENSRRVDSPDITLDDLLGQLLYSIGISYFETISFENEFYAKTLQLIAMRQPSEAMVTQEVKVDYLFDMPRTLSLGGVNIDVDRNVNVVYSPAQDKEREKAFMILSGLASSVSENRILEAYFNVPSVSAVRLLKLASEQGVPIYTITSSNLNSVLSQLQIESDVVADISNAVSAGKNVIISKSAIAYEQWSGVGYIILDPVTNAASFMISGGLSGGGTSEKAPIDDPKFKNWMDRMAFKIARWIIVASAYWFKGTLYNFGSKKGGIDCSSLTARCYAKAGVTLLYYEGTTDAKTAVAQYNYAVATDDPLFADLVFFQGSYDKNCDGYKAPDDGVSHVGILVAPGLMISAQGTKVQMVEVSSWGYRYPQACMGTLTCENGRGVCTGGGGWVNNTLAGTFKSFVGYGKILP